MSWSQNMADIRKESGLSQKELAEKIGWSRPQIQRYETEKSIPTIDYLKAFCDYYKISADWILEIPKGYNKTRR